MKNSKLVQLLKLLSKLELKHFGQYLTSDFIQKRNDKIEKLFDILKEYHPKFDNDGLNKKIFLSNTFPDMSMYFFNHTMSDLTLILEDFLAYLEVTQRKEDKQLLLAEAMNRRGASKLLRRYAGKLTANLEKKTERDVNYYYAKIKINHLLYFHPATQKLNKRTTDNLRSLLSNLDLFYFTSKLKYSLETTMRAKYNNEKYTICLLPNILELVNEYDNNFLFKIYQTLLFLLETYNQETYKTFKIMVYENISLVRDDEKLMLFQFLVNYITLELKAYVNNETYLGELFNHYQFGLEHKILTKNRLISEHTFHGILDIAFSLEKINWVENFINKYIHSIDESIQERCMNLALANLHFEKAKYKETLRILSQYNYTDYYYGIRVRVLNLKTYYQLLLKGESYFDKIEADCDAFRNFLKRNAIDVISKKANQNFIRMIRLLIGKHNGKTTKNTVVKRLKNMKYIAARTWLLEKIKELK